MTRVRFGIFYSKYFVLFGTGFMVGVVTGTVIFSALVSNRLEQYYQRVKFLESVNDDKTLRLQKLEESLNKTKFILRRIEINLLYDGDNLDRIMLEKYIREKYHNLLGKEVNNIDIDLVAEVIENRIMRLDEKEYKLGINRLLLSETLKIWVEVNLID